MEIPCTLWYMGYANKLNTDFIFCIYFEYLKYHQYFSFFFFLYTFTAYLTVWLVALAALLVSLSLFWLSFVYWGGPGAPAIVVVGFFFDSQVAWDDRDLPWNYLLLFTYLLPLSLSKAPSLSFFVVGATYAQAPCMVQVIFAWAEKSEITSATYPGEAEKSRGRGGMLQRNKTKHNKFLSNLIVHMPHHCPSPFTPHHTNWRSIKIITDTPGIYASSRPSRSFVGKRETIW